MMSPGQRSLKMDITGRGIAMEGVAGTCGLLDER